MLGRSRGTREKVVIALNMEVKKDTKCSFIGLFLLPFYFFLHATCYERAPSESRTKIQRKRELASRVTPTQPINPVSIHSSNPGRTHPITPLLSIPEPNLDPGEENGNGDDVVELRLPVAQEFEVGEDVGFAQKILQQLANLRQ